MKSLLTWLRATSRHRLLAHIISAMPHAHRLPRGLLTNYRISNSVRLMMPTMGRTERPLGCRLQPRAVALAIPDLIRTDGRQIFLLPFELVGGGGSRLRCLAHVEKEAIHREYLHRCRRLTSTACFVHSGSPTVGATCEPQTIERHREEGAMP